MDRVEFASQRRGRQDDAIEYLRPKIVQLLKNWSADTEWYSDLLPMVRGLFLDVFHEEGGEGDDTARIKSFMVSIEAALKKTKEPDAGTADRLAIALSTAAINAATNDAADADPEPLVLEWVTMHDDHVRAAHKAVDGQQRPPSEMFDVDGVEMPYPGWPGAPIELWINCRCVVRPAEAEEAAALSDTIIAAIEGEDMEPDDNQETETPALIPWHGVLAPEGVFSGDGRQFLPGSLSHRDLPLPLTWQKTQMPGHDGSVTVASIDEIKMIDGMMHGAGQMLTTPEADEFTGLMAHFGKYGVSVDADLAEMEFSEETEDDMRVLFSAARVCSASGVNIPAFAEAYISLGEWPADHAWHSTEGDVAQESLAASASFGRGPGWITNPADTKRLHDYWTKKGEEGYAKINWGVPGDFNRCRVEVGEEIAENSPEDTIFLNQICAQWHHDALGIWPGQEASARPTEGTMTPALSLVAAGGKKAPAAWFKDPELTEVTHLTVTEEGRVFGHLAAWDSCHIGFEGVCVAPPNSTTDYAYFANKRVLLDDGTFARTGVLTSGGGHARPGLGLRAAIEHYDSTSTGVADISVGEDEFGIWMAGWTRPHATEEQVYTLRASDVSGDWREVGGNLELCAALGVNTGGFSLAASAEMGVQTSLVAAGVVQQEAEQKPVSFNYEEIGEHVAAALEARARRRDKAAELAAEFDKEEEI